MSRLVKPATRGAKMFSGSNKGEAAQEYGERVAKYVPGEIIAAYLTLLPIVTSGSDANTDRRTILLAVIFGLGVFFTPAYLWRYPAGRNVKLAHLVVSTLAFVIWCYSIPGGLFNDIGIYDDVVAPILLVVFTLASGLVAPSNSPPPAPPSGAPVGVTG